MAAEIAAKKATLRPNVTSRQTWTTCSAATARKPAISAGNALSQRTASKLQYHIAIWKLTCRTGSKVKCSNCQEFGHTKVRCKQPPTDQPEDDYSGGFDSNAGGDSGGGQSQNFGGDSGGGGDWGNGGKQSQDFGGGGGGGDGW